MKFPSNQQVVEAIARAPNMVTLQQMVQQLNEAFPHAPKESRAIWNKAADDLLISWIREAVEAQTVNLFYASSMTIHAWPTSAKGREKIQEACRNRWRALGATHFGADKL
jgi:hypothetical protein